MRKKIVELGKFMKNVTKLHEEKGVPIMEAYIQHLLRINNEHFDTYEDSCLPCSYDYTAIVKTDDLTEMNKFFTEFKHFDSRVRELFSASRSTIANMSPAEDNNGTKSWRDFFTGLTPETWIKLLQHYRKDFVYFDYYIYYCDT